MLELSAYKFPVESQSALSEYKPAAASGYNSSAESAYEPASESQYYGPAEAETLTKKSRLSKIPIIRSFFSGRREDDTMMVAV